MKPVLAPILLTTESMSSFQFPKLLAVVQKVTR